MMIDEDTHAHLTPEAILNCWSGINEKHYPYSRNASADWRLRDDKQPVWLDEYRSKNGYEGARKALTGLSPDEIVNQVKTLV